MSDPTACACGSDSGVIETRRGPNCLRRRRVCLVCGARWTTYEVRIGSAVLVRPPKPRPEPKRQVARVVTVRSAFPVGGREEGR